MNEEDCEAKMSNENWTATSVHIYSPRGYYLAQAKPHGCRKWRTIKGARGGDRKFRRVSKAVAAAAQNMKSGLRARVIFCAEWHDPLPVWEARWT